MVLRSIWTVACKSLTIWFQESVQFLLLISKFYKVLGSMTCPICCCKIVTLKILFLYYFSMSQISHHFQMNTQSAVAVILMKVAHKTYPNQKQFNLLLNFYFFCVSLYIGLATFQLHEDIPLFGQPTQRNTNIWEWP